MHDLVDTRVKAGRPRQSGLMHIGEVAERVSLSHRTVRYYDEAGLLVPTRSSGNFRLFTEADVERLMLIRTMKPLGFSLEDMGRIIELIEASTAGSTRGELRSSLQELLLDAQRRRDKMAAQLRAADELIDLLQSLE